MKLLAVQKPVHKQDLTSAEVKNQSNLLKHLTSHSDRARIQDGIDKEADLFSGYVALSKSSDGTQDGDDRLSRRMRGDVTPTLAEYLVWMNGVFDLCVRRLARLGQLQARAEKILGAPRAEELLDEIVGRRYFVAHFLKELVREILRLKSLVDGDREAARSTVEEIFIEVENRPVKCWEAL